MFQEHFVGRSDMAAEEMHKCMTVGTLTCPPVGGGDTIDAEGSRLPSIGRSVKALSRMLFIVTLEPYCTSSSLNCFIGSSFYIFSLIIIVFQKHIVGHRDMAAEEMH